MQNINSNFFLNAAMDSRESEPGKNYEEDLGDAPTNTYYCVCLLYTSDAADE